MLVSKSKLEIAMAENELTIADIRKITGTSTTTFAKVKRGKDIRPDIVGRIAKTLNIDVTELIEQEEQK